MSQTTQAFGTKCKIPHKKNQPHWFTTQITQYAWLRPRLFFYMCDLQGATEALLQKNQLSGILRRLFSFHNKRTLCMCRWQFVVSKFTSTATTLIKPYLWCGSNNFWQCPPYWYTIIMHTCTSEIRMKPTDYISRDQNTSNAFPKHTKKFISSRR